MSLTPFKFQNFTSTIADPRLHCLPRPTPFHQQYHLLPPIIVLRPGDTKWKFLAGFFKASLAGSLQFRGKSIPTEVITTHGVVVTRNRCLQLNLFLDIDLLEIAIVKNLRRQVILSTSWLSSLFSNSFVV